ncbi:MAG: PCMD domain-containing protein [Bacteroidales bacterium]
MFRINRYRSMVAIATIFTSSLSAQKIVQLPYSDMNSWVVREFKESGIIGGNNRTLYEIGKSDTIKGAIARIPGDSPWETSSVYAKVSGVVKGSSTVFPEKRGNGYCARLETRLEEVQVLGLINLKVLATGTIFTGKIIEPVRDSKDPMQKLMQGIPYTKRVKSIRFDYKAKTGGKRIKSTGFSRSDLPGKNAADISVILQKRWEDANGNIYAKRVGTGWTRITESTDSWVNDFELPIEYGDITSNTNYQTYKGLFKDDSILFGVNSKGEPKRVLEIGWGNDSEEPTHMIIRFSAGYGGAYVGAIGDVLWIDNVKIVE